MLASWLVWATGLGALAATEPSSPGTLGAAAAGEAGRTLAGAWCGGCHAAPDPADLDRATWIRNVLPEMGARLGIREFRGRRWRPDPTQPAGTYPVEPLLSLRDWAKIFDYYRDAAPVKRLSAADPPRRSTTRFEVLLPPARSDGEPAATTGIFVDAEAGRILVGDGAGRRVLIHDRVLRLVGEVPVDTPPVHFAPLPDGAWLVTLIGSLAPGDPDRGAVVRLDPPAPAGGVGGWRVTRLVRRLPRPVRTLAVDADRDGLRDLVVAGFGDARGGIFLHRARLGGGFDLVPLLEEPGAVSIAFHGGDLYALMAQGDERLLRIPAARIAHLTENGGDGMPRPPAPEVIRRLPPQRGSSGMRVLDFDGNGTADLLVTAGDNADFTPVFKRGHGVRLYLGEGGGRFRLALFHRLDGAYGAVAEDFDGDGDRDIAAIAWFADFSRGPERAAGFVYLENLGSERFRAARVPGLERLGRFAVMDAGDLDRDGYPDIVLGNLAYGAPGPAPVPAATARAWAAGPRFVVLRARRPEDAPSVTAPAQAPAGGRHGREADDARSGRAPPAPDQEP